MAEIAEKIVIAWQRAASELEFEFTTPFSVLTPDHRRAEYLGLVHGFGRSGGTLLRVLQLGEMSQPEVLNDDYLVAKLADNYIEYHPWLFQETLRKWGWRGVEERRPKWC